MPDSFPRAFGSELGKKIMVLGRKGNIPGHGNAMLASHLLPALAMCWEEPCVVWSDYFISHEMKKSWLSQRPGSVLFGLGKQDAGQ